MRVLIPVFRVLFDPRGRSNRQSLLIAASVVVMLEIGLMIVPVVPSADWLSPVSAIKGVMIWICCASVIKRLHDLDISGWWLPGGMALACMWTAAVAVLSMLVGGSAVLQANNTTAAIVLGLVMMPVLGATLWLHLTPGSPVINRFGAPERQEQGAKTSTRVAIHLPKNI
jgi:uncharacterized membrane protein YhaH (DUF805 family)